MILFRSELRNWIKLISKKEEVLSLLCLRLYPMIVNKTQILIQYRLSTSPDYGYNFNVWCAI